MKRIFSIIALSLFLVFTAQAAKEISAGVHEVTSEGAWCWFADPRALHYESKDGSVNSTYIGYIDTHGSIKAMQYDFNRKRQTEVLIRSYFQPDDHDNPTFLALPDGRIMIFYSRHTDEPCFYYRVSAKAGDITTLGEEKIIKTKNNTTYPSPFILSADPNHIYLCWRGINWHPTIARLTLPDENDDVQVADGPYQIVQSTGARPYAKYMSDGKSRIYLAYTTGHPDNEYPNYLYFNYIEIPSLKLTDVKGKTLSSVKDSVFRVYKTEEYVKRYPLTTVDADNNERNWLWQVAADKKGRPSVAMVHISRDKQSHRYYYVRWTGREWRKTFIGDGGRFFHQSPETENCYSSGMAIDHADANIIYVSLPVQGDYGQVYELFKVTLTDNGEIKSKEQITRNSRLNNVRPYVIPSSVGSPLRLAWMNGRYYDWIVSARRPCGYCTAMHCDFSGFNEQVDLKRGLTGSGASLSSDFTVSVNINLDPREYGGTLFKIGDMEYSINASTLKPELHRGGKTYASVNVLGTADTWKLYGRGTGGHWYDPMKYTSVRITLTCEGGTVRTYINGLLDQTVETGNFDNAGISPIYKGVRSDRIKTYNRVLNYSEIKALR